MCRLILHSNTQTETDTKQLSCFTQFFVSVLLLCLLIVVLHLFVVNLHLLFVWLTYLTVTSYRCSGPRVYPVDLFSNPPTCKQAASQHSGRETPAWPNRFLGEQCLPWPPLWPRPWCEGSTEQEGGRGGSRAAWPLSAVNQSTATASVTCMICMYHCGCSDLRQQAVPCVCPGAQRLSASWLSLMSVTVTICLHCLLHWFIKTHVLTYPQWC